MSKRNRIKTARTVEPQDTMTQRRIRSLTTLYYNRFMLVRYTCAACFFGNFFLVYLTWGTWIGFVALALMILALPAFWQLGTMFGKSKVKYQWIKLYTPVQWVFNAALFVLIWTVPMTHVFPFFSETPIGRATAAAFVGIGLIMLTLSNLRLHKIDSNIDKTFRQIKFYEEKYNLTI